MFVQMRKRVRGHSISSGCEKQKAWGLTALSFVSRPAFLSVDHFNALVALAPESFAVSSFLGASTPPIYFSSACFPYIKGLKGDEGLAGS